MDSTIDESQNQIDFFLHSHQRNNYQKSKKFPKKFQESDPRSNLNKQEATLHLLISLKVGVFKV